MSQAIPADIFEVCMGVNGGAPGAAKSLTELPEGPPAAVDLETIDFSAGDPVRQMRSLANAVYAELKRAYLNRVSNVDVVQRRYEKVMGLLAKVEASDREERKQTGDLIPRAQVEMEAAQAAMMLRQMRESMSRRIVELCPSLDPEQRAAVENAINRVRCFEDKVFQKLQRLGDDNALREVLESEDYAFALK
jgi:hypothetical protein